MKIILQAIPCSRTLSVAIFLVANNSLCETNSLVEMDWKHMTSKDRLSAITFTTPAYQQAVLSAVIDEANKVAKDLDLSELLPIAKTNLLAAYISPPKTAHLTRRLGNITTSNYVYYVSCDNKFSSLVATHLETSLDGYKKSFLWPVSRVNTNSAFRMANQILTAARIDVNALNQDCDIYVEPAMIEGINGKHFIPVYSVIWAGRDRGKKGAFIQFFEPTRSILQMNIDVSKYILRLPLQITNLDYLLSQTNAPADTNMPKRQ